MMSTKCPKCNTENPDSKKFCGDCGTPLEADVVHTKTLEAPKEELTRGSIFADRYEIIEELGKGGMGKVYRVEDTKVKEEIALKLIKPEISADKKTIERFRNELKTARKIRHKNVCGMFDLGEEKGQHYITMEYVSGGDLKRFIRRAAPLNTARTIFITKQICEGLEEAHSLGIVHRDLKPNNIMIDDNGNARIMDFGIARTVKGKGITGSGVMIGTPEYMSPEQVEAKEVDQRSDIYSVGIIMYEMLTGRLPFEGETPFAIGVKQKSGIPKDPKELNPQIPQDLSGVILKCLEKDTENRYQSAGAVRSELEMIEQGLPTTDRVVSKKKTITSREITVQFSMRKIFIPSFIMIAIVAVGLMIWSPWKQRETVPIQSQTPSIAVLPFRDLSRQQDQGHLCEGMTIEIIVALSNLQGWKVMNMISVLRYKDSPKDPKEIGQELDVKAILLGSVRREDEDIRINVQLVNVEDNFELWSEMYEKKLEGVFTIQSDIAEKIAKALDTEIVQVK
ncbi:MAG: protein kinase [Candidatus Hodarchaeota archaeon]